MEKIREKIFVLEENIGRALLGKRNVIRQGLVALFAGEHILLEDVPGVGKTLLGRALAKSISCTFRRIQFTSDLIPADITGGSLFDPKSQEFRFTPGPIFANILLADEINRTTPRTQSAMLEAMSERQVSCDGQTHKIEQPFMVIATENPIEFEGTYPLPESQLDRFLMRVSLGYPDRTSEREILRSHQSGEPLESIHPVLDIGDVTAIQSAVKTVRVAEAISDYVLDLVGATRHCDELFTGVSPRGAIALIRASQASALMAGRDYVIPDDIKELAIPVLAHRVLPKSSGLEGRRALVESILGRLLAGIRIPN